MASVQGDCGVYQLADLAELSGLGKLDVLAMAVVSSTHNMYLISGIVLIAAAKLGPKRTEHQ